MDLALSTMVENLFIASSGIFYYQEKTLLNLLQLAGLIIGWVSRPSMFHPLLLSNSICFFIMNFGDNYYFSFTEVPTFISQVKNEVKSHKIFNFVRKLLPQHVILYFC